MPQFFLLIALYEEDNILISNLAEKVSIDRATLTGILDRLERDGFVERVFSKNDRRSIYIKLTSKAKNMENELRKIYEQTNSSILSKLSQDEYETFQNIINKLEKI
jgi:DNA-binding MarR family transcriptional regulator